tara:strand:+ start:417 stop:623 length:207 start_codon:yes stop_codon:yes gene_type:complete
MDLAFAPEDAAFCEEVRTFRAHKLPERLRYKVENGVEQLSRRWIELQPWRACFCFTRRVRHQSPLRLA